jgi:hypothetical protein
MSSNNGFLNWLSCGNKKNPGPERAAGFSYVDASTGEDDSEFIQYLSHAVRPFRKRGVSVKQEYELWLGARAKTRPASAARASTARFSA